MISSQTIHHDVIIENVMHFLTLNIKKIICIVSIAYEMTIVNFVWVKAMKFNLVIWRYGQGLENYGKKSSKKRWKSLARNQEGKGGKVQ